AQRYPSAEALAKDLDRWLHGQLTYPSEGRLARLRKGVRRRPLWTAAVILGTVLAVALAAAFLPRRGPHDPTKSDPGFGPPIPVLGPRGRPEKVQWIYGADGSAEVPSEEGYSLETQRGRGAIVLVGPTPPAASFVLEAEVRHDSTITGTAGIFF